MIYTYNISTNLDNTGFDIKDAESFKVDDRSKFVLLMDSSANDYLYEWYNCIQTLCKAGHKVILVMDKYNRSSIRKQICMLMASYGAYNMYEVGVDELTDEYMNDICQRDASEMEVEEYIGTDVVAFDKANEILLKLKEYAVSEDIDSLMDYTESNKEIIVNIPIVVDFLKKVFDSHVKGVDTKTAKLQETINKLNEEKEDTLKKYRDSLVQAKASTEKVEALTSRADTLEKEVGTLNKQKKELEEQIKSLSSRDDDFEDDGPMLKYKALDVANARPAKYVIYFKELAPVTHAMTMIRQLQKFLQMNEKKVNLAIYERPTEFAAAYCDMRVMGKNSMSRIEEEITSNKAYEPYLLLEPNMNATRHLLMSECDILIIFDRLRCKEDLVKGSTVFKFNLAGNLKQLSKLEESSCCGKLSKDSTIVENNNTAGLLYIPYLANYDNGNSEVAKTTQYASAMISSKDSLFDKIIEKCGLDL